METFIVKEVENLTTSKGAPYKKVSLEKTDGTIVSGVSAFSFKYPDLDGLKVDAQITASIVIDGNYKNLVGVVEKPKGGRPNMDRVMEKKADMVAVAQDKKAQNIAQAQDRSAWMWAKNNAAMLIANSPALKTMNKEKMADAVIDLATLIYNGEPTEPFSSKPQNIKTAPIEGVNYPEEDINPEDIPF